ncbi:SGNH/GDSL hydrolase family protein [Streptomyces sp. NRRL F-2580]|uniref:SGNH/GDSL hydrolase family protein n=1 Tax=Streptomyces sp. NRRL F-2580 TaxID=1463841 RepID=UPI000AE6117C|nr:SGNH/GDSL hydrolase family protein [Streptomyces sp. NRRL F-2580]
MTAALTLSMAAGIATSQALAAPAPTPPTNATADQGAKSPGADAPKPEAVPEQDRSAALGKDYRGSKDRAWTTSGDGTGFHVLLADEKDGYKWRTAATLSEPGFDTDTWIGNACLTQSGTHAAVAYAPRTFTNKPELMARGAFTAIVNLRTGQITKLPVQASLGYFSPGCGTGDTAVFSQFADETAPKNETRLVSIDAPTAKADVLTVPGQVTSAIPVGGEIVAAQGPTLVKVTKDGKDGKEAKVSPIKRTSAIPFQLMADAEGGVTFIDRVQPGAKPAGKPGGVLAPSAKGGPTAPEPTGEVDRVTAADVKKADGKAEGTQVATGKLEAFDLARTPSGTVFVTGTATSTGKLPGAVKNPGGIAKEATVSSEGQATVMTRWADGKDSRLRPEDSLSARAARTTIKAMDTGTTVELDALPTSDPIGGGKSLQDGQSTSPALENAGGGKPAAKPNAKNAPSGVSSAAAAAPANDTVDADRFCSVPRNDPRKQAFQPTPRQVEWAVDQTVIGQLNKGATRPANWKNTGMAAYAPQSLFPLTTLDGDPNGTPDRGDEWHVPSQVLLGITAQESNMWQATRYAVPGVTANSLIGNFYGVKYAANGTQTDPWAIDWADADCGYGITQVTDGMRVHGHEKDKETPKTTVQQEAVALDYAANIASGVNILIEKWNSTRRDGLVINDGHPKWIENWTYALWAYNAGYHAKSTAGENSGKWGVGWTNNPANPLWKANRTPFLEDASGGNAYYHAAAPQHWPYQEKVIGWAARPIEAMDKPGHFTAGFREAWWLNPGERTRAMPPIGLFCDASNDCDRSKISDTDSNKTGQGACLLPGDPNTKDPLYLKCWYNKPATWKNCKDAQCGTPVHRFNDTYPEQPDEASYPPRCTIGLPEGTHVIDDLPNGYYPAGGARNCANNVSAGTFQFTFSGSGGAYPGKIDTHQIGAGFRNHFWFAHTRDKNTAEGAKLFTSGTWTLNKPDRGWMRVWVHIPDHGAHTRQAAYQVKGTDSTSAVRVQPQRVMENKWADLGVFNFTGTPQVILDNHSKDGDGSEDIAWDAVGFQPLAAKPTNFTVAMGDSYSSGEGASASGGGDYYKETDVFGKDKKLRNACHRSTYAWSRQATLPGYSKSIGAMSDDRDPNMDYHLIACSGAQTENILSANDDKGVKGAKNAEGQFGQASYGELPQLDKGYLDQNTTLVTMSIGGNDSRFTDVIKECLYAAGLLNCQHANLSDQSEPLKVTEPRLIKEKVRPSIVTTLKEIAERAPHAKIVLMGYPPLLEGTICIPGINGDEQPWLNEIGALLVKEMDGAAADARAAGVKVQFSDPTGAFKGKAICGSPESIHGIVTDKTPGDEDGLPTSAQSFHPKIAGARLYANSLESTLNSAAWRAMK